ISAAAGRAVLHYLKKHNLIEAADSQKSGTMASNLGESLRSLLQLEIVGDVRGIGLLWGVEFVADKKTKQPFSPARNFAGFVGRAALKRGLLVYPMQGCVDGVSGDHLLIAPPAVLTPGEVAWAVEQLKEAIQKAQAS